MCEYFTQMIYLAVHRLTRIVHNIILNTVLSNLSMKTELDILSIGIGYRPTSLEDKISL